MSAASRHLITSTSPHQHTTLPAKPKTSLCLAMADRPACQAKDKLLLGDGDGRQAHQHISTSTHQHIKFCQLTNRKFNS
jgi:hypothetical protein